MGRGNRDGNRAGNRRGGLEKEIIRGAVGGKYLWKSSGGERG